MITLKINYYTHLLLNSKYRIFINLFIILLIYTFCYGGKIIYCMPTHEYNIAERNNIHLIRDNLTAFQNEIRRAPSVQTLYPTHSNSTDVVVSQPGISESTLNNAKLELEKQINEKIKLADRLREARDNIKQLKETNSQLRDNNNFLRDMHTTLENANTELDRTNSALRANEQNLRTARDSAIADFNRVNTELQKRYCKVSPDACCAGWAGIIGACIGGSTALIATGTCIVS